MDQIKLKRVAPSHLIAVRDIFDPAQGVGHDGAMCSDGDDRRWIHEVQLGQGAQARQRRDVDGQCPGVGDGSVEEDVGGGCGDNLLTGWVGVSEGVG